MIFSSCFLLFLSKPAKKNPRLIVRLSEENLGEKEEEIKLKFSWTFLRSGKVKKKTATTAKAVTKGPCIILFWVAALPFN